MKEKKPAKTAQTTAGIDDAVWEKTVQAKHSALLIVVIRDCIEDSTQKIEEILPRTKISPEDRVRLLSALSEVREALELEASQPEAFDRYQALSISMVKRPATPKKEASAP